MRKGSRHWIAGGVVVLGVACAAMSARAAETVYRNINTDPLAPWQPIANGVEIGDDVTLAGTSRLVTQFNVPVFNDLEQTFNGTVTGRFYDLDQDGFPGTELWEQTIPIVSGGFVGDQTFNFTPNVIVPNDFIWTLQFATNLASTDLEGVGPLLNDQPQTGSSEDVFFLNNHQPGDDQWEAFNYASVPPQPTDPLANFQAEIIAEVPEPGALSLLGIAALAMLRRRR